MADFKPTTLNLIGIMVVVLIVISIVVQIYVFFTRDKDAPLRAERETVQTAMYAMLSDNNLTQIDEHTSGPAVNDWTAFPTGLGTVGLRNYMETAETHYYYCWDANGEVWGRNDPGENPTTVSAKQPGECSPLP